MKRIVLVGLLGAVLIPSCFGQSDTGKQKGSTKDSRDWKPATVAEITSTDDQIVKPNGFTIPTTRIIYRFETADVSYLVREVIRKNGTPLNVTLHGQTKVAIEGMHIHILDDAGKDVRLPIVQKVDVSPMKDQAAATPSVQSNPPPASPQPPSNSQSESGVSDADVEALGKLLQLEPPQFCDGAPILSKLMVGTMTSWKSALDSESLANKIQIDSEFEIAETKLWRCSHAAVMRDDGAAFQQTLLALALVEQMHLAVRQSSLDDAVNSMTTLSSAVSAPAKPSASQRVGVALQGVMNGLNQWAEYQRQLRLARMQNRLHCTTTTWGRTTYTDCY
jgi:hypothetical protein